MKLSHASRDGYIMLAIAPREIIHIHRRHFWNIEESKKNRYIMCLNVTAKPLHTVILFSSS